jgi:hypothetical protein
LGIVTIHNFRMFFFRARLRLNKTQRFVAI